MPFARPFTASHEQKFTATLAERLNRLCQIEVLEAKNGDRVIPGRALIAPGGKHMMLKRNGAQYVMDVADGPLVNRHKPSVMRCSARSPNSLAPTRWASS